MQIVDITKTTRIDPSKRKEVFVIRFREDGFSTSYYADMEMLTDEDGAAGVTDNGLSVIDIPECVAADMRKLLAGSE